MALLPISAVKLHALLDAGPCVCSTCSAVHVGFRANPDEQRVLFAWSNPMAEQLTEAAGVDIPNMIRPNELEQLWGFIEASPIEPAVGPITRQRIRTEMASLGFVSEWDSYAQYTGLPYHELGPQALAIGDRLTAMQLATEASVDDATSNLNQWFGPMLDPTHEASRVASYTLPQYLNRQTCRAQLTPQ